MNTHVHITPGFRTHGTSTTPFPVSTSDCADRHLKPVKRPSFMCTVLRNEFVLNIILASEGDRIAVCCYAAVFWLSLGSLLITRVLESLCGVNSPSLREVACR